ncbi:MAG TPA: hypothetical protein VKB88_18010 [Bryobacteraceae bacterium]|nr:hypothetical protein [Bryobacteraceae bacterium]
MKRLRALLPYIWIPIGLGVLYNVWVFTSRQSARTAGSDDRSSAIIAPENLGGSVKIVQFYARDGIVIEGRSTVLCYGVLNAKSVRLEPSIADVWPSVNRCVDIHPARETRYTLTAEGADGRSVSESFNVQVAADASQLPRITSFRVTACKKDYLGDPLYKVSFADENAVEVSVDPAVIPTLHGAPFGEFYVSAKHPTTVTLSVKGKYGHTVRQQLVVDSSQCK